MPLTVQNVLDRIAEMHQTRTLYSRPFGRRWWMVG